MSSNPLFTQDPTYEGLFQHILPQPHALDLEFIAKQHAHSAIEQALSPVFIDYIEQELVLSQEWVNFDELEYEGEEFIQEYIEAEVRPWACAAGIQGPELLTVLLVRSSLAARHYIFHPTDMNIHHRFS
jgi:hypothetical protein